MRRARQGRGAVSVVLLAGVLAGVAFSRSSVARAAPAQHTGVPVPVGETDETPGSGAGTRAGRSFSGEITIRQQRINRDGAQIGTVAPQVHLRFDRRDQNGHWQVSLELQQPDRPVVRAPNGLVALDNPFVVTRMEFTDRDDEPRMYGPGGRRVRFPSTRARQRLALPAGLQDHTWDAEALAGRVPGFSADEPRQPFAAHLLAPAADRAGRRARLERRFGRAVGRVGDLDRFVATSGDSTDEVLVAPDSALPVEVNTVRRGRLVARAEFAYDQAAGGFLRRRMRAERLIDQDAGVRAVTDVELDHVVFHDGGTR